MTEAAATISNHGADAVSGNNLEDFVTFTVKGQMFGVPVLKVQDVLKPDRIANIPLAPPEVRGAINLRGRIVTIFDVRVRLGFEARSPKAEADCMGVTIEHNSDLYTLLVDEVGDVVSLAANLYEDNPRTLDPLWREFSSGIYRLEDNLMVVLDVDRLLDIKVS